MNESQPTIQYPKFNSGEKTPAERKERTHGISGARSPRPTFSTWRETAEPMLVGIKY